MKTTTGHAVVVHFCLRLLDRATDQILTVLLRYIIRSGNCSTCGVDQVLLATALYKRRIREVAKFCMWSQHSCWDNGSHFLSQVGRGRKFAHDFDTDTIRTHDRPIRIPKYKPLRYTALYQTQNCI